MIFNPFAYIKSMMPPPVLAFDGPTADEWAALHERMADTKAKYSDFAAGMANGFKGWDAAAHCRNSLAICPKCRSEARTYDIGPDKLTCAACGFAS